MKINTANLEAVRNLLATAAAALAQQTKEARAAEEERLALDARVRGLQGAFDIAAAAFAGDVELSRSQLAALPAAVQSAIGYQPPEPEPAAAA